MMKKDDHRNNENGGLVYIKLFVIVLMLIFYAELCREYWSYYNYCNTYLQEEPCCYYCYFFL